MQVVYRGISVDQIARAFSGFFQCFTITTDQTTYHLALNIGWKSPANRERKIFWPESTLVRCILSNTGDSGLIYYVWLLIVWLFRGRFPPAGQLLIYGRDGNIELCQYDHRMEPEVCQLPHSFFIDIVLCSDYELASLFSNFLEYPV